MTRISSFYVFALVTGSVLTSCKAKPPGWVVNRWKVKEARGGSGYTITRNPAKMKILAATGIEFTKDWKYIASSNGSSRRGSYAFANNGTVILFFDGEKPFYSVNIEAQAKNTLVISDHWGATMLLEGE